MAKPPTKRPARRRRTEEELPLHAHADEANPPPVRRTKIEPFEPATPRQRELVAAIEGNTIVFALGPAGCGKSHCCIAAAVDGLKGKRSRQLILTRPIIEVGNGLGFLPGEESEKYMPYIRPMLPLLQKRMGGRGAVEMALKEERILPRPIGFLLGETFEDCDVLLDEAQNLTPLEMKLFLTRLGNNARLLINGDAAQQYTTGQSGLEDAVQRLTGLPGVAVIRFSRSDIVRHDLVQAILDRYDS